MYADIGDKLFELSDPEYQKFASSCFLTLTIL